MDEIVTFEDLEQIIKPTSSYPELDVNICAQDASNRLIDTIRTLEKIKSEYKTNGSISKKLFDQFEDTIQDIYFVSQALNLNIDEMTKIPLKKAETFFTQHYKEMLIKYHSLVSDQHSKEKQKSQYFTLLFADIDNFREFNTNYGHHLADKILVNVVQRLKSNIHKTDEVVLLNHEFAQIPNYYDIHNSCKHNTYISREGGEEIILLFRETDKQDAKAISQRLLDTIRQPFHIFEDEEHREFPVTISIGAATKQFDFESKDYTLEEDQIKDRYMSLLKQADDALYQQKVNGKDGVSFFNPTIDYQSIRSQYNHSKS